MFPTSEEAVWDCGCWCFPGVPQNLTEEAEGGNSSLHDTELLGLGVLVILLIEKRDCVFNDTTK